MEKIRILIVDSVEDDVTRRRHGIFAASPRLRDYDLAYCYAADIHEQQEEKMRWGFKPDITVKEQDLQRRIAEKIMAFQPRFVLLHTGFVFRDFPDAFIRAFISLKASCPDVQFGYQERAGLVVPHDAFHNSAEVLSLQNLIFREVLG